MRNLSFRIIGCLFGLLVFSLVFLVARQSAFQKPLLILPQRFFHQACTTTLFQHARCHAQVVTDSTGKPFANTAPTGGFGPVQFHTAYQLPCTPGGAPASTCATPSAFQSTIAIVDAYNDPTVENDLNVYSNAYGIPLCTIANGCLNVVNQNGTSALPATDSGWALEISLDTQIAHTLCQTCKILLVEATSSSISDLATAENTAANLGATVISNSYGGSEWSGETSFDSAYTHSGIAITASSGDSGYGVSYPASSKNVIAVGGTTLQLFSDNTYSSESVWSGTGSGCSTYESANSWQTNLSNWQQTGCGNKRGVVDVAADADPNSGAAVYDSTPYSGQTGWWIVGGTSLASPIVASEYALSATSSSTPASLLYTNYSLTSFHDITSGSNGSCSTIMCKAASGYDGPTGLGSLNGLLLFSATPTPTFTPTPTPVDTIPPTVAITQPSNNAIVRKGSRVTISVSATDNVKVAKVVVTVGGASGTATTAPYNFTWHVPYTFGKSVKYTIVATAYDTSNNSSKTSITVTAQ